MSERGLLSDFSSEAMSQARALPDSVIDQSSSARDLRGLLWSSIDNDDSRDLDQLSIAEPLSDGATRLLVAIADVDVAVPQQTAIDQHARVNTTSVYTAAGVFPMLPLRLSTDVTSLNPDEDRMAIVVSMAVARDGTIGDSEVFRAVVRNRAKLAYNSVGDWLEGRQPMPQPVAALKGLDEQLRMQDRAAQAMRRLRHQRGALSLETIEARPVFQGEKLSDLDQAHKNRATELIEDLMVGANTVVSQFLHRRGFPSLRRVLQTPKRWDRIVALAAESGSKLPAEPNAASLESFLLARRAADPDGFPELSLAVVKLLGSGEYAVDFSNGETSGHFGLAVRDYSHSTAPNRRFPDLTTQRLVKAALAGSPVPYSRDDLAVLARHCTLQEDNAAKVERQVRKSAAALLMRSRVGERFTGIVTGASDKGTWVRIFKPVAEGRVVTGFQGWDVGDRVQVELVSTDVERGFIDFAGRGTARGAGQSGLPTKR
jgi:exoribonuclease-2